MNSISAAACRVALALTLPIAALTASAQQGEHADVPRDGWQRVGDVFTELGVAPGGYFADIGAGHGYFTTRLAKAVGPSGRVYAVDVNPVSLRELKDAIGADHANVEIVRGDENDPHLPAERLDGALIVNAYHEFAEYPAMLRHILSSLKPGGRLVLIEPIPRVADTTRPAQAKRHSIAIDIVERELADAGYEVVKKDPAFVSRPEHRRDAQRTTDGPRATDWLVVARRPGAR